MSNQLVWYRNDLRTSDNAALTAAIQVATQQNSLVFAAYIYSAQHLERHGASTTKFNVIQTALQELTESLSQLGVRLLIIDADSWTNGTQTLAELCIAEQVTGVHCHFEPGYDERKRDKAFNVTIGPDIKLHRYNDVNLVHPSNMLNKQGSFYKVFTAYKKALLPLLTNNLEAPLPSPSAIHKPIAPEVVKLDIDTVWSNTLQLPITENQALNHLDTFLAQMPDYKELRDFPSLEGTSKLSVALSIGTISARQVVWAIQQHGSINFNNTYLSEIIWRDFYKYLTYHRPDLCLGKPFNEKWDAFPWRTSDTDFNCWANGETGVPIVDAAMRQLNQTGWMHNRLRMVVGMYLVKIMQLNWRLGEAYFAERLADFDFSANNGGWQWVASTGVDAAPYFRIFNPYEQSRRFDGKGHFIRTFVPEITNLDEKEIHQPTSISARSNNYPTSLVDYKSARVDTLAKFKRISVTS